MRPFNILFVDDMTFYRSLIQDHLRLWSHKTNLHYVPNAQDAIALLKDTKIDIIICDLMMPKHTGYDLLKSVRKSPKHKDIPFVMLSSQENQKVILKIIEAGANEYIMKPWDAPDLYKVLDRFLIKNKDPES